MLRYSSIFGVLASTIALASSAPAAVFQNDFDGVNDDAFANIASAAGGGFVDGTNEWLVLTNETLNQIGTPYVPVLNNGMLTTQINAKFSINQSAGSTDEADGLSFYYGKFNNNTTALSDGAQPVAGLRVRFHIENNAFANPDESITVHYDGGQIFNQQFALTTDTIDFRDVQLAVNTAGDLDLNYDGTSVISGLNIASWDPQSDWQFAFTARTGGRHANQFLDNLRLTAVVPEPSAFALGLAGLVGLTWLGRRRRNRA